MGSTRSRVPHCQVSKTNPWRYCCPECGAHRGNIRYRVSAEGSKAMSKNAYVAARWPDIDGRYACNICGWTGDQLHDKKENGTP